MILLPPLLVKRCSMCSCVKPRVEFRKRTSSPDGLRTTCKPCHSTQSSQWAKTNSERVKRNYKNWKSSNEVRLADYSKNYYLENRERVLLNVSKYRANRLRTCALTKATKALRNLTSKAFSRKGFKKRSKCNDLLGCDFTTATSHIESQFKAGMSWENHGEWHIDHIVPLASEKTVEGREKLCHYTNLRPLWAWENRKKSSKVLL